MYPEHHEKSWRYQESPWSFDYEMPFKLNVKTELIFKYNKRNRFKDTWNTVWMDKEEQEIHDILNI